MTLLRRIAGGVVFVVALITFLLCVTGTIGAWFAKATVDATSLAVIDTLTDYLDLTVQTIDTLDANVAGVEQKLEVLRSELPALRAERADRPAVQRVQRFVTDELQPALEQLTLRAQRLQDGLERFNQRLEQLGRLPLPKVPALPGALARLDEQIEAARAQAEEMRAAIETRDPVRLESAVEDTSQRLGQIRAVLEDVASRVTATRASLGDIRQALTFWSTVSTAAVSALLAIFAAGQISLAVHAWGWMRGQRQS
ncbi:MAG: hypothetical protein RMK84_00545 [Oscillochloridaceae bacterium]|nr:hypothetical protein [Chloroflexaceae bacterium]MDW8388584.1 hypothetical protein [Oscillochloridaceae bacterium]